MKNKSNHILFVCVDSSSALLTNQYILKEIEVLAASFKEVHVCVFAPRRVFKKVQVVEHFSNTWLYYASNNSFVSKFHTNTIIGSHLKWKGGFRADRVISYGLQKATRFASLIAKRFLYPHYIKIFLENSLNKKSLPGDALKNAYRIFVENFDLHKKILKKFNLKEAQCQVTPPYIDFEYIASKTETVSFNKEYQKDFFFVSHMTSFEKNTVVFLCTLMGYLQRQYMRSGFVLYLPKKYIKKTKRIIRSLSMQHSFFVEEQKDDMFAIYRSARVYIGAMKKDSLNLPVLYALASSVPVVSTPTGYAKQIYQNSPFGKYLCNYGDVEGFYVRIRNLIEDSYEWSNFKVNSSSLLSLLPHITKEESNQKFIMEIDAELHRL